MKTRAACPVPPAACEVLRAPCPVPRARCGVRRASCEGRRRVRHAATACAVAALGLLLGADTALIARQQPQPTFRSGVTLVTVDVTVLDKDGTPVPNLTAGDFEVKLNGKTQPVRVLTFVQAASGDTPATVDARGVAVASQGRQATSNAAPAGERRVFVILVDDLSFAPLQGKKLFAAAERFVGGLPASDLAGLATTTGAVAVNPTVDRAAIRGALGKVVGDFNDPRTMVRVDGPSVGIGEALAVDSGDDGALQRLIARECFNGGIQPGVRSEQLIGDSPCAGEAFAIARRNAALAKANTARQVKAYLSVIGAMRSASGIKHLVILSDGLAAQYELSSLTPIAKAAAEAGVQLSLLIEDPDALNLSDPGRSASIGGGETYSQHDSGAPKRRSEDGLMFVSGVQTVADITGGNFYRVIGDPDPFFEKVKVAASAVYRLGVEPLPDTAPGRAFAVVATVKKAGLTAHANRHAVAPGPAAVVPVEEQLRAAIGSGTPLYNVPISLATALRRSLPKPGEAAAALPKGQIDLGVNIEIPASAKAPLTTMFGLIDDFGAIKSGRRVVTEAPDAGGYRLTFSLPVAPGKYKLRFAVADASGSVGSVETAVTAQLTSMGPFAASDLLTWWVDVKGQSQFLALEAVPAGVDTLHSSIELYSAVAGAAVPEGLHVKIALFPSGAGAGAEAVKGTEHDRAPDLADGVLHAEAEFEIGQLTSGTYVIRATVMLGDKVIGTASASVRKR